jgi:hypothetical protein
MPASLEPIVAWIAVGAAASFLLWAGPRLWTFVVGALADRIVEGLEGKMAPSWQADLDNLLDEKLDRIHTELSINGGGSVKDLAAATASTVQQLQKDIEPLVARFHKGWDDPEGTPV